MAEMRDDGAVAMTTGILLAGGASRRFPPDKLAVELDGVPLLWHPLRALASVADEVVVVIGVDAVPPPLPPLAVSVRVERDVVPDAGPLVAVGVGLATAAGRWAIVVAGDMPWIRPGVLAAMRDRALRSSADVVVLASRGDPKPLPCVLRVSAARGTVDELARRGERRLRALVGAGRVEIAVEEWWRPLDPAASWSEDVDRPEDLRR